MPPFSLPVPLLRPLPFPRTSFPTLLRQSPSRSNHQKQHRISSPKSTPTPTHKPTATPTPKPTAAPTAASPATQSLSYHISRTASLQLPVYQLAKRGGSLHQTRIRKISGSVYDLRKELRQALGLGKEEVTVNAVTGHIVIKGWRRAEVLGFLEERRF